MSRKNIVIYHGNCADGFGAAWAMKNNFPERIEVFIAGQYGKLDPVLATVRDCNLLFVDFSYKLDMMMSLCRNGNTITLIDHHKSMFEDLGTEFDLSHCSLEKSGAVLAFEYCYRLRYGRNPEQFQIPLLLRYIQDRDLWKFNIPASKEIAAWYFSYPYDFEGWNQLARKLEMNEEEAIAEGEAILRKQEKDMAEYLAAGVETKMQIVNPNTGKTYVDIPAVNCPYFWASEIGHKMAEKSEHGVGATFYFRGSEAVISFRSIAKAGGILAKDVAVQYGGGGHPHASGCTLNAHDLEPNSSGANFYWAVIAGVVA